MIADQRHEVVEILNALAGAEVDAEPIAIDLVMEQARVFQGVPGGSGGEAAVSPRVVPAVRILDVPGQVEIPHLRGDLGREALGVKERDAADAATAFELVAVQLRHAVSERRDRAHAGDNNSSSHRFLTPDG